LFLVCFKNLEDWPQKIAKGFDRWSSLCVFFAFSRPMALHSFLNVPDNLNPGTAVAITAHLALRQRHRLGRHQVAELVVDFVLQQQVELPFCGGHRLGVFTRPVWPRRAGGCQEVAPTVWSHRPRQALQQRAGTSRLTQT
jgi:hypothetical protein